MATRARNNKRKKPEPSEDLSDHEEGHVEKKAKKAVSRGWISPSHLQF
jgi:hypothetical protein